MANDEIDLGGFRIGKKAPVFLIAEIGINHNGSLETTKRLMDAAFACGWQCVKFQKRTPEICVPEDQKNVMRDTPWGRISYLDYRRKVEFGEKEYAYIDTYAREKPILWTASVWDLESLRFIMKHDAAFLKIPSAKMNDLELLRESCRCGRPVMVSTGMSSLQEIDAAVDILEKHTNGDYVLMHANSAYPTPPEDINLRVIPSLAERYKCIVGYSGHEIDLEPSVISAVLGARVIERHVTLDHNMWGSDHFASLEVHGMNMLIKRVRDIDVLLGDGVKRITQKEMEVRKKLRGA